MRDLIINYPRPYYIRFKETRFLLVKFPSGVENRLHEQVVVALQEIELASLALRKMIAIKITSTSFFHLKPFFSQTV